MRLLRFSLMAFFRATIADTRRVTLDVLTVASNDRDLAGELAGIGVAQHPGEIELRSAVWRWQPRSRAQACQRFLPSR